MNEEDLEDIETLLQQLRTHEEFLDNLVNEETDPHNKQPYGLVVSKKLLGDICLYLKYFLDKEGVDIENKNWKRSVARQRGEKWN